MRIPHNNVETALLEHLRKSRLPIERPWVNIPIRDDAVANADAMVEARERLAPLGGLDPEAEPADLDRLLVEIHAVEIVLQDVPIEIEKRARTPKFFESVI